MLSPLAAVALSVPAVVKEVLLNLARMSFPFDAHPIVGLEHAYPALCTAALVSRCWRDVAQRLLQRNLIFTCGKQVKKWLETRRFFLPEPPRRLARQAPFKPQKADGDGAKWSYEAIGEMLKKVQGTMWLYFLLMGQREVPGEWLTGENLRDVQGLDFSAPFTPCTTSPHFSLAYLVVHDFVPRYARNWTASFELLKCSPSPATLHSLDLVPFSQFAKYALDLIPFVHSLHALALPSIALTADVWRLILLAPACKNLHLLSVETFSGVLPELLLAFPSTLAHVNIDVVLGTVGAGAPDILVNKELIEIDTWSTLTRTVDEMEGLKFLRIGEARHMSIEQHTALEEVAKKRGFDLDIKEWDHDWVDEEKERMRRLVALTKAKEAHDKDHPKEPEYSSLGADEGIEDVQ
ncbi:hypothetical protein JCM6882_000859 [Rhodosporidiobolus microsporus]